MRQGLNEEVTQDAINKVYDLYNDNYPEADRDLKAIGTALNRISTLFSSGPLLPKFFKSQVHFYPLVINVMNTKWKKSSVPTLVEKMGKFIVDYERSGAKI